MPEAITAELKYRISFENLDDAKEQLRTLGAVSGGGGGGGASASNVAPGARAGGGGVPAAIPIGMRSGASSAPAGPPPGQARSASGYTPSWVFAGMQTPNQIPNSATFNSADQMRQYAREMEQWTEFRRRRIQSSWDVRGDNRSAAFAEQRGLLQQFSREADDWMEFRGAHAQGLRAGRQADAAYRQSTFAEQSNQLRSLSREADDWMEFRGSHAQGLRAGRAADAAFRQTTFAQQADQLRSLSREADDWMQFRGSHAEGLKAGRAADVAYKSSVQQGQRGTLQQLSREADDWDNLRRTNVQARWDARQTNRAYKASVIAGQQQVFDQVVTNAEPLTPSGPGMSGAQSMSRLYQQGFGQTPAQGIQVGSISRYAAYHIAGVAVAGLGFLDSRAQAVQSGLSQANMSTSAGQYVTGLGSTTFGPLSGAAQRYTNSIAALETAGQQRNLALTDAASESALARAGNGAYEQNRAVRSRIEANRVYSNDTLAPSAMLGNANALLAGGNLSPTEVNVQKANKEAAEANLATARTRLDATRQFIDEDETRYQGGLSTTAAYYRDSAVSGNVIAQGRQRLAANQRKERDQFLLASVPGYRPGDDVAGRLTSGQSDVLSGLTRSQAAESRNFENAAAAQLDVTRGGIAATGASMQGQLRGASLDAQYKRLDSQVNDIEASRQARIAELNGQFRAALRQSDYLGAIGVAGQTNLANATADRQIAAAKRGYADDTRSIQIGQANRGEELAALYARDPVGARAAASAGASRLQARQLRLNGRPDEAVAELKLGASELGLERRNYLEGFRGTQLDLRNIGVDNVRDKENPANTLKTIDTKISQLMDLIKNLGSV
jgi:hypothetical protein